MGKNIVIAVGMIVLGWAGAAAADSGDASRAVVHGREVVWLAPQAEKPYALTGEREAAPKAEKQTVLQPAGRSGYVRVER